MQSFWLFVPIPKALPTVAKELVVRGLAPERSKNIKNKF